MGGQKSSRPHTGPVLTFISELTSIYGVSVHVKPYKDISDRTLSHLLSSLHPAELRRMENKLNLERKGSHLSLS